MAKKRKPSHLSMGFHVKKLPRGVTRRQFFTTLVKSLKSRDGKGKLPRGWDVSCRWRNAPNEDDDPGLDIAASPSQTKHSDQLREDTFDSTVKNSTRGGFIALMIRRLQRELDRLPEPVRKRRKRHVHAVAIRRKHKRSRYKRRSKKARKSKASKRRKVSKLRKKRHGRKTVLRRIHSRT